MKRINGKHISHYCGYPQSKGMRIIGNELHANQEQALEKRIMRKVKAYAREEGEEPGRTVGQDEKKEFEKELEKLQVELVKLQHWVQHEGMRVIIVFEGCDAAGKGGTIERNVERVSPRVFRVVALPAPTEREKTEMYMQRYMAHFPVAGEVIIFDRSWYNRAGVEHVMGFCTQEQYEDFLQKTPLAEHFVIQNGILLIKYWLEVSEEEQDRRFKSRIDDGRKIWKLSPMDVESHRRWYDYSRARDTMFEATNTETGTLGNNIARSFVPRKKAVTPQAPGKARTATHHPAELTGIPGMHHVQARGVTITTSADPRNVTFDGEVRVQTPIYVHVAD